MNKKKYILCNNVIEFSEIQEYLNRLGYIWWSGCKKVDLRMFPLLLIATEIVDIQVPANVNHLRLSYDNNIEYEVKIINANRFLRKHKLEQLKNKYV